MYIPFQELSEQASIWVYQATQQLSPSEKKSILEQVKPFLANWSSHGRPLLASAEIRHDYFLILGIEKADFELTCCTIDSAIQFLHTLKASMGLDFLDRSKVVLQSVDQRLAVSVREAKEKLQVGGMSQGMHIFDNTITHKKDLETRWLIPAHRAWFAG